MGKSGKSIFARCLAAVPCALLAGTTAWAQPTNDDFAGRLMLSGDSVVVTTTNTLATSEPGEPAFLPPSSGYSLWWSWTAPDDGIAVFNAYSETGCQPLLGIFTGTNLASLAPFPVTNSVVYNGQIIGPAPMRPNVTPGVPAPTTNTVFAYVTAGTTYQIQLDSRPATDTNGVSTGVDSGRIYFGLALARYPTNDNFDAAIHLTGADTVARADNTLATEEPGETNPADWPSGQSCWWTWTAPASGLLTLSIPTNQTVQPFAIYTGTTFSNLVRVGHNRRPQAGGVLVIGFPGYRSVTIPVASGVTYRIVGDSAAPGANFTGLPPQNLGRFATSGRTEIQLSFSTLVITSPDANERYLTSSPIPLRAEFAAENIEGPVDRVQFYFGVNGGAPTTPIASVTAPPYQFDWTNAPAGELVIRAVGYTTANSAKASLDVPIRAVPFFAPNDDFTNRTALAGASLSLRATNSVAGFEPGEPPLAGGWGRTLWYSWTAPGDGTAIIDTDAGLPTPVLAVFTGDSLTNLALVTNNSYAAYYFDTNCLPQLLQRKRLAFPVSAGQQYQLAVDGYARVSTERGGFFPSCTYTTVTNRWSGAFDLAWTWYPLPANDQFAQRAPLVGSNLVITTWNFRATREAGEPLLGATNSRSIWYTWTAPYSGTLALSIYEPPRYPAPTVNYPPPGSAESSMGSAGDGVQTYNSANNIIIVTECTACGPALDFAPPPPFFPVLGVYQGNSLATLTTNAIELYDSELQVEVVGGQTYQFAFEGFSTSESEFTLYLELTGTPPNDHFASRIALSSNSLTATGYNVAATREPGEPPHADDATGPSVWWSWTAPHYGTVGFNLSRSTLPYSLAVYQGTNLGSLFPVTSGQGAVSFFAQPGHTYQVAVGSFHGLVGAITLDVWMPPAIYRTASAWTATNGLWLGEFDTSGGQSVVFQRSHGPGWTNLFAGPATGPVMMLLTDDPDVAHQHRVQVIDEPLPPPFLSRDDSGLTPSRAFQVGVAGIPAQEFVLWSSTNLYDWSPLTTNRCVEGVLIHPVTNTGTFPAQFYRVTSLLPPPAPPEP